MTNIELLNIHARKQIAMVSNYPMSYKCVKQVNQSSAFLHFSCFSLITNRLTFCMSQYYNILIKGPQQHSLTLAHSSPHFINGG